MEDYSPKLAASLRRTLKSWSTKDLLDCQPLFERQGGPALELLNAELASRIKHAA